MIRAWHCDERGARDVEPVDAVRFAAAGTGAAWIDFDGSDQETMEQLLAPLKVHPLAIEDMVAELNRPKVDNYGPYLYLVVHSARWEPDDRPRLREIDFLVGETFLVSYHEGRTRSVDAGVEVLSRRPELLSRGPAHLLHFMLDVLVDNYLPIVDRLGAEVDQIETATFGRSDSRVHLRTLRLKRGLAALRRIIGPQRDTVLALTRDEFHAIPAERRPYLRDIYDRLARVHDMLDSIRDEVAGLLDLQLSVASNRLNSVIKVLTVVATLALPITAITSYYGMNFRFAAYEWSYGEFYVLGLLAASLLGTWWILKLRRWL